MAKCPHGFEEQSFGEEQKQSEDSELGIDIRMLVHEAGRVVDLIVYHDVEVLLTRMFRDIGICELLDGGRHGGRERAGSGGGLQTE
jgi:hypothetical protein